MLNANSKKFLHAYLNNLSPVGYEKNGQTLWLDYLKPYTDSYFTDSYGTAVAVINPDAPYKVVLEAHADEISWYVNYIDKNGYMYVIRNGGSDYQIAPSMNASIHTEKGLIPAFFGWPAIHVRQGKKFSDLKPEMETVVLDGGFASDKEAEEKGVHVGSIVTFDQDLREINQKFLVGRGLDNRMGGFMIAQVARLLHEQKVKVPFGLYIVNAVQEEVGLRGARMIAERIRPNVALVTDVTHDTQSPLYSKIKEGDIACGKGPVISFAPAVQHNVRKMLEQVAKKEKVAIQRSAASVATGTDADAFAYSHTGIPTALLSLPLKYMHTTVEMVAQKDVEQVIQLMTEFVKALPNNHNFSYFK